MNDTAPAASMVLAREDAHAMRPREEYSGLQMAISPAEAHRRLQELQAFIASVMVVNVDFGKIPGTGDKPTLLQPGAQKLAEVYGLAHRFEVTEQVKDWDRQFFYFEYRCILVSRRDGSFVGEGLGSCNSRESKYAYRWAFESDVPAGLDKARLERREGTSKKNGRPYFQWKVPNQDVASLVNTIQKMAAKRAYVHAVIAATRTGAHFTQDVEDLPPEAFGKVAPERSWDGSSSAKPEAEPPAADLSKKATPPEYSQTASPQVDVTDRVKQQRYAKHAAELQAAPTLADLKKVCSAIAKDQKAKRLTQEQIDALAKIRDAKRAGFERAEAEAKQAEVDESGALPDAWGGAGTCLVCKKPLGADAVSTVGGKRHPACSPLGVTDDGEVQDDATSDAPPPDDVELEVFNDDLGGRM